MSLRQPGTTKMPRWIWREPKRDLPRSVKTFVRLIWRFDAQGCPWWNCVLARYFKVTPRTIQYWIHTAKFFPLISVAYGDGRGRVLRRLPYHTRRVWQRQKPLWYARLGVKGISPLDNAQQDIYSYRRIYLTALSTQNGGGPPVVEDAGPPPAVVNIPGPATPARVAVHVGIPSETKTIVKKARQMTEAEFATERNRQLEKLLKTC